METPDKTTSSSRYVQLLKEALSDPEGMYGHVLEFSRAVHECAETIENPVVDTILHELAFDLEFYEPDPVHQQQSKSYFGERRAAALIRRALKKMSVSM